MLPFEKKRDESKKNLKVGWNAFKQPNKLVYFF